MSNEPDVSAILTHVRREISIAKLSAFEFEAWRVGEYVFFGLLPRGTAADMLHDVASSNGIVAEWGLDKVQSVIAAAFKGDAQ